MPSIVPCSSSSSLSCISVDMWLLCDTNNNFLWSCFLPTGLNSRQFSPILSLIVNIISLLFDRVCNPSSLIPSLKYCVFISCTRLIRLLFLSLCFRLFNTFKTALHAQLISPSRWFCSCGFSVICLCICIIKCPGVVLYSFGFAHILFRIAVS